MHFCEGKSVNTITLEQIEAKIKDESYLVLPDGRSTLCILTMENGFTVKGLSACVDRANFDINAGRKVAREDAVRQIWMLEGYLLTEQIYRGHATQRPVNETADKFTAYGLMGGNEFVSGYGINRNITGAS